MTAKIVPIQQDINNSSEMTSREIAELTGKRHADVLRDIDKLIESLSAELRLGFKTSTYEDSTGKNNRQYILDRDSSYCLVAGYDATARMKIIKRWQALESTKALGIPNFSDPAEAAEAWAKEYREKQTALIHVERLRIELDQSCQWASIKKIAELNGIGWRKLDWRKLKTHGMSNGMIPHKVFDANFPEGVNVYHVDTWTAVYPDLRLPGDEP